MAVREARRIAGLLTSSATDYPTRRSVLASRRRDNRRLHSQEPRPNKFGHLARHTDRSRKDGSLASNEVARSTAALGRPPCPRQLPLTARRNGRLPPRARYLTWPPDRLAASSASARRRARRSAP